MRPLLQHASRFLSTHVSPVTSQRSANAAFSSFASKTSTPPSICLRCQFRASSIATVPQRSLPHGLGRTKWQRRFSSSKVRKDREPTPQPSKAPPQPEAIPEAQDAIPLDPPPATAPASPMPPPKPEDTIKRVPAEDLPSHKEGQRWDLSKRVAEIMDNLLPKLAQVTHKVNAYTGTDYSSIEALRREIMEQEQLVRARRIAIDDAKAIFDSAHAQQASAQKEVVALLERKHSWSAADLERYMTLIRSEHVNDQAVREAKEAVQNAESALEEARSQLEKRERAQYHEEQIWSDTIRRNSTWVTFGLMGFNIFLLLASLAIFEPWRRRRMVREIKSALEAQKPAAAPVAAPVAATLTPQTIEAIEAAIDDVVDTDEVPAEPKNAEPAPAPVMVEEIEVSPISANAEQNPTAKAAASADPLNTDVPVAEAIDKSVADAEEIAATIDNIIETPEHVSPSMTEFQKLTAQAKDLISERYISIRKKDLTNAVLAGVAAGCTVTTVVILAFIKPH